MLTIQENPMLEMAFMRETLEASNWVGGKRYLIENIIFEVGLEGDKDVGQEEMF